MKFTVDREKMIRPLQQVAGVVERRQTLPILSNLLMKVSDGKLSMTGTDLEVELVSLLDVDVEEPGEVAVPARKIVDICRELPEGAEIDFAAGEGRLVIRSGRFRSTLSTLPPEDFPTVDLSAGELTVDIAGKQLRKLLARTAFAMAHQDVRYFLNGMLVELGNGRIRSVATDGHRLALGDLLEPALSPVPKKVIVPRKGVMELQRLLQDIENNVRLSVGSTHLSVLSDTLTLTTKLIDGKFPKYGRVIPRDGEKVVIADREALRQALSRTAILTSEKLRAIRVVLSAGQLQLVANNPEQDEAEDMVSVEYEGDGLEVGFNVVYLQDVLSTLECEKVRITLHDADSSAVIEDPEKQDSLYVVMPMKL